MDWRRPATGHAKTPPERIVDAIRASLAELASGTELPAIGQLAEQYETTPSVVEQALELLEVERLVHRGGWVKSDPPRQ